MEAQDPLAGLDQMSSGRPPTLPAIHEDLFFQMPILHGLAGN
jgi:hypothetical protein